MIKFLANITIEKENSIRILYTNEKRVIYNHYKDEYHLEFYKKFPIEKSLNLIKHNFLENFLRFIKNLLI